MDKIRFEQLSFLKSQWSRLLRITNCEKRVGKTQETFRESNFYSRTNYPENFILIARTIQKQREFNLKASLMIEKNLRLCLHISLLCKFWMFLRMSITKCNNYPHTWIFFILFPRLHIQICRYIIYKYILIYFLLSIL